MRPTLAIIACFATSCFSPDYQPGLPCSESGQCPDGQMCGDDNVCRVDPTRFDASVPPPDPDAADDAIDAAPPGFDANLSGEFATPVSSELSTSDFEGYPTLTADALEIFFASDRGGSPNCDIWTSTRTTTDAPWSAPTAVVELSTSQTEITPEVSPGGLTIWWSSNRPGGMGGFDIWVSTRADRTSPWATPQHVPELSSNSDDYDPAPVAGLLEILVSSDRSGGEGSLDQYIASRASTGDPWGTPVAMGTAVNTDEAESGGHIESGGLELFFTRSQPPSGNADIFHAERSSTSEPFGNVVLVENINTSADDGDSWVTPDTNYVIFESNRLGGYDLFESSR